MMDTYFPTTIVLLLEGFRQSFPARHFAYFRGYIWALVLLGTTRKCMTNVARTCVFVERHRASWERFLAEAQWDLRGVSQTLVTQLLRQLGGHLHLCDAWLAAVDTTLISKVRGKMPGVQTWHGHSGNPARGGSLVGHHWALIGLVSTWGAGYLCWPVLARLLPGQRNPLGFVAGPDGIQRLDFWLVVVALVRELRQYVGAQRLRVVADAYFSKASFLNPLAAEGLWVISRLRKDAVGWDDPAPVMGKRPRGRPRKRGRIWPLATLLQVEPLTELTVLIYGKEERVQVVWRDVWLRDVTPKVRVVVVATKRAPILLVSTDLTLPPAAIIVLYAARFPMELSLRDGKQYLGLGDYQCQSLLAIHRFVHLTLTAYWLWRLTMLQEQQGPWLTAAMATPAGELSPLSFQRLHRALRRLVLRRIFAASAPGADSQKPEVSYERIFRIAA
jgi:DDE superfamily endonuclease